MHWVDVCGAPGVGKSTLCDPLWGHRAIGWDTLLPPADWQPFLDEITRLFHLIRDHWSFDAAVRMNRRSLRKMATVARMEGERPYIQIGFVQRGLGFGWRLADMDGDVDAIRRYFRLMPVSIGVAMLTADLETVVARNRARPVENRDFMVPLMKRPRAIALEELRGRGVPVVEIDTRGAVDHARRELVDFAARPAFDAAASRPGDQVEILSPPAWW